jgi:hypothetical protein
MDQSSTLEIYCDTNVLPANIDGDDPKSKRELAAVKELQKYGMMFGSHIVHYEAANTPDESKRKQLTAEQAALRPVPKDEKLLGFNATSEICGQYRSFVSRPVIADVQDESIRNELIKRGLEQRDAEHITQAVCNKCNVFLTRDEKSIIKPHRAWLEQRFPNFKVWLPSELLGLFKSAVSGGAGGSGPFGDGGTP